MSSINQTNLFIKDKFLPSKQNGITHYTPTWAQADVEFLNKKIDAAQKKLTSWDFYKIAGSITNKEQYAVKVNALLPYTGLIIDSDGFDVAGETQKFTRGDVVFKNSDYTISHIKSERGGIFYPSKIEKNSGNNNYTFTFSFTSTTPSNPIIKEVAPQDGKWENDDPLYRNISFTGFTSTDPSSIYGQKLTPDEPLLNNKWNTFFLAENNIYPIVKYYSSVNEEVYWDSEIALSNDTYTISNIPELIVKAVVK